MSKLKTRDVLCLCEEKLLCWFQLRVLLSFRYIARDKTPVFRRKVFRFEGFFLQFIYLFSVLHVQVMHDYVYWQCSIDYCVELNPRSQEFM